MTKHVVVLGAGMVGRAIALDLSRHYRVTALDIDAKSLHSLALTRSIKTHRTDLSNPREIKRAIKHADLVIGALPGFMGFQTLKTVIESKKPIVDISFFGEDPFDLDDLAKRNRVVAVVDCGVAPGMSNLILGHFNQIMTVESFECLVGGLPFVRTWPYQYKAPFSPIDVLAEYTRPARLVENGQVVVRPALSDPEQTEFESVGTLESFNTDGLRTLLKTMKIPNMREKTLRYPGHRTAVQILRDSGFFSTEPVVVGKVKIRPLDFTACLLFPLWELRKNDLEFTAMRITILGNEKGVRKHIVFHLFDRFDETTSTSSMARTTGYACTAAARLVLEGHFSQTGICPPEYIGSKPTCFDKMMESMKEHNIHFVREDKILTRSAHR